jgi:quinol monooxygenase YgiN
MSMMVMWEGRVEQTRWAELRKIYDQMGAALPEGVTDTWMVQDSDDPEYWRLISLWRDRGALDAYRNSGGKPGGLVIFESVGATPERHFFDVVARRP